MLYNEILGFYRDKKVFITGHTGFKGTWLVYILLNAGAKVTGYALEPPTKPNLFSISGISENPRFTHIIGDIRDLDKLKKAVMSVQPEIVFHLAAQPIVRSSYEDPIYTYSTNVMGTVNILECIRTAKNPDGKPMIRSFLNVTTDKVYKNREWCWGYRESEVLDGYDPYSNSKSCSELITHAYQSSFFSTSIEEEKKTKKPLVAISTARAGNVIGGGDFSPARIIPDSICTMQNAFINKTQRGVISVRNPYSIRPYQHVLDSLAAYLMIVAKQSADSSYAGSYNVGPDDSDCVTTGILVDLFCQSWNANDNLGVIADWEHQSESNAPHESNFLKLDCSKIKTIFGWNPKWHIKKSVEKTVEFYKTWIKGENIAAMMDQQIRLYFKNREEV